MSIKYSNNFVWPPNTPRTAPADRDTGNKFTLTLAQSLYRLELEVERWRPELAMIHLSCDLSKRNGEPLTTRNYRDREQGLIVAMDLRGQGLVQIPVDAYQTISGNARGACLTLEALRAIKRHGGNELSKTATMGFAAIPATTGEPVKSRGWALTILGLGGEPSKAEVKKAWRKVTLELQKHDSQTASTSLAMRWANEAAEILGARPGGGANDEQT